MSLQIASSAAIMSMVATISNMVSTVSGVSFISSVLFISRARDWISDKVPWPPFDIFGAIRSFIDWVLNIIVTGFLDAIGLFFRLGVEYFLIYDNPYYIEELNQYWRDSIILYVFIVFIMMFGYYVVMMLLADTEDAKVQRMVERLLLSGIFLVMSREVFAFFVALTNELAYHILPEDYSFYVAVEMMDLLTTGVGTALTAAFIAIFGGIGILISGALFYVLLAMRMLIIYTVYAILPVLLALWVVDVGPGKYGKFFADFLFKVTAVMMLMGVVMAAMLSVGAAFGAQDMDGVEMASDYDSNEDGTTVISTDPYGPQSQLSGDAEGGELAISDLRDVVFSMFMFIGVIWVIISTTVSMFGMVISAGSTSAGGTGGTRGHGKSTSGSQSGDRREGAWGARHGESSRGTAEAYELEDGRVVVANPAGGGATFDPDPGPLESSVEGFGPNENPLASSDAPENPFNTEPSTEGTPINEKLRSAAQKPGEVINDKYGYDVNSAISGAGGTVRDVGGLTYDLAVPNKLDRLGRGFGGLSKRAGKAYWSVFKQPDVQSSLAEEYRIARESPIGGPNEPNEAGEDGPVLAVGKDAFVLGREHESYSSTKSEASTEEDPSGFDGSGPFDEDHGESSEDDGEDPVDYTKYHEKGYHEPQEYEGRGPELPRDEDGNVIYGPAPEVEGPDSAKYNVVHNQSKEIAEQMGVDSYKDVSVDSVMQELESASGRLDSFDLDHNSEFSEQKIEFMLQRQQQLGVPANVAVQRTSEAMLNSAADPVGGLHGEEHILDQFGVEEIPEELATGIPARRINLSREGTGGTHGQHMWRIERNDGSIVYAQDVVASNEAGANALQTEEILKNLGVNAPEHHYDPVNRVIRSQGIDGVGLGEVIDGETDFDPSEINRESFLDAYASMGLAGHNDCHADNLLVKETGEVVPIDYDFAGSSPGSIEPQALEEAVSTANALGMNVTREDVANRMEEMAQEYVDEVDSTAELVADRMPPSDNDVNSQVVEEQSSDGMPRSIDRQVEYERKKAVEQGKKVHEGIEDVANGDTEWQRSSRGENTVSEEKQSSDEDISAALEDVEESSGSSTSDSSSDSDVFEFGDPNSFDDDDIDQPVPDRFEGLESEEDLIDLDDANSYEDLSSDEPSETGSEEDVSRRDKKGSDTEAEELDDEYDVTEEDVYEVVDDVLDDMDDL